MFRIAASFVSCVGCRNRVMELEIESVKWVEHVFLPFPDHAPVEPYYFITFAA